MNASTPPTDVGYLIVKVFTAEGAIPLPNAAVIIRGESETSSGVLYSLSTNADGATERVSLPTPARIESESPGAVKPFATYSIDVVKGGYLPLSFHGVPVFASVLSIQPAVMIPAPDGRSNGRFPPTPPNLSSPDAPYGDL